MKKEINISEIGEYSLEELSSSIYSNPIYKTKISNLSRWDILNIFRERSFNNICLKILTIELGKSKIEPLTKETFDNWKFKNELIRELLIFPSSKRRIRVVKSDPRSHKRIINFIHKFKYIIKNEIPECLLKEFEKIVPEEIIWDLEDDAFVRECIGQDTASHYNGASGILFTLKNAMNNGVKIIDATDDNKLEVDDLLYWISNKYNSTLSGMIQTRDQIKIIE